MFILAGTHRPDYWLCTALLMLSKIDQFSLPLQNFAFGIITTTDVDLLGYSTALHPELQVEHYRLSRVGQALEIQ